MRQHYVFTLVESEVERFRNFVHALACKAGSETGHIRRESVILLLRVFYWDIFVQFKKEAVRGGIRYGHKEELVYKFLNLVTEHYSTNREVSFYADKLCISPKYLTMVVHDVTGKSAKECIVEHTLLEIKSLLRDASLDIKDVVRLARFSSQSLLSRFSESIRGCRRRNIGSRRICERDRPLFPGENPCRDVPKFGFRDYNGNKPYSTVFIVYL